jgi:hypothetical protein
VPNQLPWYAPIVKAIRAGTFFVAHAFLAILFMVLVAGVKQVLHWLDDPKLFDWVPLSYIFDAMDAMALVVFLLFGTIEAIRVFRE